jgi:hypothetical protein
MDQRHLEAWHTSPQVRAGRLDDTLWLRPTVHLWTCSKQRWIGLPAGDRTFEAQPATLARCGHRPETARHRPEWRAQYRTRTLSSHIG